MTNLHRFIGTYITTLCATLAIGVFLGGYFIENKHRHVRVDPVAIADFTADKEDDILYKTKDADSNDVLSLVRSDDIERSEDGGYFVTDLGKPVLVTPPNHKITEVETGDYNDDGFTDIRIGLETSGNGVSIDLNNDDSPDIMFEGAQGIEHTYFGNGRGEFDWRAGTIHLKLQEPEPVEVHVEQECGADP